MAEHILKLEGPRTYFAEVAYYIWGQVNYDSEGDCVRPTDRDWNWLYLKHREMGISLHIEHVGDSWRVRGSDPDAARAAHFLCVRCGVTPPASVSGVVSDWDHVRALARSKRVAEEFACPELHPFDNHDFWGSWKWDRMVRFRVYLGGALDHVFRLPRRCEGRTSLYRLDETWHLLRAAERSPPVCTGQAFWRGVCIRPGMDPVV